ncbi:hypothetical protein N7528_008582 [Penicillium herquei]|nr:hypothetical protein N7528_008582 [Penicillium herquei]
MEATIHALVQRIAQTEEADEVDGEESTESQTEDMDEFQGETAFQSPVDTFNARIASLRALISPNTASDNSSASIDGDGKSQLDTAQDSIEVECTSHTIRFGSRKIPFPGPAEYARYLDFFFGDINTCHPCLNEADFSSRTQKLIALGRAEPADASLLATNFILFALTDILTDITPVRKGRPLPGWQWYSLADDIMGKRKISGRGDLRLIQFLIYEALYLTHADKPNAAYNISGLACRLCFQLGIHQQDLWAQSCTPFSRHMRQRVFWTVYYLDRRISLSCGRPYGIRDCDVSVDQPDWIDDQAISPDQELPAPDAELSSNVYLSCMIKFAKFAGEIWDQAFSVTSAASSSGERTAILDARIKYWLDTGLCNMPLLPQINPPTKRHLWQSSLVRTRMSHLRLLLRRRTMVSMTYTTSDGLICGQLAMEIIQSLQNHATEAQRPSSFRFHIAISLGGAILILATLLCRDISIIGLQEHRAAYIESYRQGITMLRDVAVSLHAAVRILYDLRDIVSVVDHLLEDGTHGSPNGGPLVDGLASNIDDLFPNGIASPNFGLMTELSPPFLSLDQIGTAKLNQGISENDLLTGWDYFGEDMSAMQGGHGIPWV